MARDYEAALADFAQARITLQAAGDGLGLADELSLRDTGRARVDTRARRASATTGTGLRRYVRSTRAA